MKERITVRFFWTIYSVNAMLLCSCRAKGLPLCCKEKEPVAQFIHQKIVALLPATALHSPTLTGSEGWRRKSVNGSASSPYRRDIPMTQASLSLAMSKNLRNQPQCLPLWPNPKKPVALLIQHSE